MSRAPACRIGDDNLIVAMFEHEDVPPLDPGSTALADQEERKDPIVDGFERVEVDRVRSADKYAHRVAERPHVRLRHAIRLEVSCDPRSLLLFFDASKNVVHSRRLGKHPEMDRRESNDVQTGRSG